MAGEDNVGGPTTGGGGAEPFASAMAALGATSRKVEAAKQFALARALQ